MKKIFITLAVSLLTAINAIAQNEELRHEIGISYGAGISLIGNGIGSAISHGVLELIADKSWANDKQFGTLGMEYFYHFNNRRLAVGGVVTYAKYSEDVVDKNDNMKVYGDRTRRYMSVMPAIKYSWINKKSFALYSKLAVGMMFNFENENDYDKNTKSSYHDTLFMMQLSAIGAEFGHKLRGFIEIGGGEQGILLVGAKYKF